MPAFASGLTAEIFFLFQTIAKMNKVYELLVKVVEMLKNIFCVLF